MIYQSGEPLRKCTTCGESKPYPLMVKCKTSPTGVRPLCKECKQKQVKAQIKKLQGVAKTTLIPQVQLTATQRNSLGLSGYMGPRERLPNEALPPQVNKMEGHYEPDNRVYFRNDGLKHIQSRGV